MSFLLSRMAASAAHRALNFVNHRTANVFQRPALLPASLLPTTTTTAGIFPRGGGAAAIALKHTLKTNRSLAKRFRVQGNGKLRRSKSGAQHNTGYKSRRKSNRLVQSTTIKEKTMERKLKICMGLK